MRPMIKIGSKPMVWHIMDYYAGWGPHPSSVSPSAQRGEVVRRMHFLSSPKLCFNDFICSSGTSGALTV